MLERMSVTAGQSFREKMFPYLLLTPTIAIFIVVLLYPLVNGIVLSFTSYSLLRPNYNWVGLQNFRSIFSSPRYWGTVVNTVGIIGVVVVLQTLLGMSMALLLNRKFRLRGAARSVVFSIWVLPPVVVAQLWLIILNSQFGVLNFLLNEIGVLNEFLPWRARPGLARISIGLVFVWRGIPFFIVMILAALQGVSSNLIDAAKIDGATAVQRFRFVVLPTISRILVLCMLLSMIRLFQVVDVVFVLTGGGPVNATNTLALEVYRRAFEGFQFAEAAAVGVTWMVFLILLATLYVRQITRE